MTQNNLPSFIVRGKCKKEEAEICNLGYACDACPYISKKHKHEWEDKETSLKIKYMQCKICKKISYTKNKARLYIRHGRIHYHTKGAFGGPK